MYIDVSVTHKTLLLIVYYLATSFDLEYRSSSGHCARTWMHSDTYFWTHSCSCTVAWLYWRSQL